MCLEHLLTFPFNIVISKSAHPPPSQIVIKFDQFKPFFNVKRNFFVKMPIKLVITHSVFP